MSDLIIREDAIKAIEARIEDKYNQNDYEFGRNQAFEVAIVELEEMPTIDAVEVVRCKDCKYYDVNLADGTTCFCTRLELFNEHDWFCADGERRGAER